MTNELQQLREVLPLLGQRDKAFAADLLAAAQRYGRLTPNQAPWVTKLIQRAQPVSHDLPGASQVITHQIGDFAAVVDLFGRAAQHLKYPKIRLICDGTPIILSIAGERSRAPGMVNITGEGQYPNRAWYGRIDPTTGAWEPARAALDNAQFATALRATLAELASDPARVASMYGKLTGNCCFCQRELTDARSVTAGYGPVCADHYGLGEQWANAVRNVSIETPSATAPIQQGLFA